MSKIPMKNGLLDLDNLPTKWASHRRPRSERPTLIVIHDGETSEGTTPAEGMANFFAQPSTIASTQLCTDTDTIVRCVGDMEVANGAGGGVNSYALHIELAGRASQSAAEWRDANSLATISNAALAVRAWSARYGIPLVKLDPSIMAEVVRQGGTPRGICGHRDVTEMARLLGRSTAGHSDPGEHFPWDLLLSQAAPIQEDFEMDAKEAEALFRSIIREEVPKIVAAELDKEFTWSDPKTGKPVVDGGRYQLAAAARKINDSTKI